MVQTCLLLTENIDTWWNSLSFQSNRTYLTLALVVMGTMVAFPLSRIQFYVLRRFLTRSKWKWPTECEDRLIDPTGWLLRLGCYWAALVVIEMDDFLCHWPLWVFGVGLIVWLNAFSSIATGLLVRYGMRNYLNGEKRNRQTLLLEGSIILNRVVLLIVAYLIYFGIFDRAGTGINFILIGICLSMALGLTTLAYNIFGSTYAIFNDLVAPGSIMYLKGTLPGELTKSSLAFLGSINKDGSQTFVPGGVALTAPIAEQRGGHWPLRVAIKLDDATKSCQIRDFVIQLESLMQEVHEGVGCFRKPVRSSVNDDRMSDRLQGIRNSIKETHMQNMGYVAVDGKWVVRVHSYTIAPTIELHREVVSKVVRAIANLVESSELTLLSQNYLC